MTSDIPTLTCPQCAAPAPPGGHFCANCGAPLRSSPPRSAPPSSGTPGWAKALLIFVALGVVAAIVVGILVARGGKKVADTVTPNPGRPSGYHGPAYPGMLTQDHVAGTSGRIDDFGESLTAADLKRTPSLLGPTLCAAVTVANKSQETKGFGPIEWKLQQPDAVVLTFGLTGTLQSGQIAPGGSASGTVCFADSGQTGPFVLLWQPLALRAARGVWLFTT